MSPGVHQQLTVASVSYMENLGVMIAPLSYLPLEVWGWMGWQRAASTLWIIDVPANEKLTGLPLEAEFLSDWNRGST